MSTIVTRQGKGSALTYAEMDANFTNLNTDKIELSALVATNISNTPSGSISATDVQAAINELDTEKAKSGVNTDITSINGTSIPTNKTLVVTTDIGTSVQAHSTILDGIAAGTTATASKNKIINGNFQVNQRVYVSAAAVGAGLYGHDRWKMAASGDTYTFSTTANVTTITIPVGKVLRQVIEGVNLQSGTYTLSWIGTAQGKIDAGSLSASGITGTVTGGTNVTIEFGPGTVSKVQFEEGSIATPFENRPIGLELMLCQRYYEVGFLGPVFIYDPSTNGREVPVYFKATKRVSPTVTKTTGISILGGGFSIGTQDVGQFGLATAAAGSVRESQFTWTASAEL